MVSIKDLLAREGLRRFWGGAERRACPRTEKRISIRILPNGSETDAEWIVAETVDIGIWGLLCGVGQAIAVAEVIHVEFPGIQFPVDSETPLRLSGSGTRCLPWVRKGDGWEEAAYLYEVGIHFERGRHLPPEPMAVWKQYVLQHTIV